jgi:undecaprenyl-diphosphatase
MNNLLFSSNIFITFLASFLIWLLFAGVLYLWVINKRISKYIEILAFLSAFVAWAITEILKQLISVPRPFEVTGYSPLTATVPGDNSFPSGHSALAFGLATVVMIKNRKLGIYVLMGAIGVALGRVLSNVHYVIDVLVGSWIGIVIGIVASKISLCKK